MKCVVGEKVLTPPLKTRHKKIDEAPPPGANVFMFTWAMRLRSFDSRTSPLASPETSNLYLRNVVALCLHLSHVLIEPLYEPPLNGLLAEPSVPNGTKDTTASAIRPTKQAYAPLHS